jgi:hypothetical protein
MNWETFYLVCFVAGLMLSAVSLLGGMGHFGGHLHLPHATHVPHVPHMPHGGPGLKTAQAGATIPWWNAFSITVFLCWFGAAGYLLMRHSGFLAAVVLVLSLICGLIGGAIVFMFLTRVRSADFHRRFARVAPGRWSTSSWAHGGQFQHVLKMARRLKSGKRSSPFVTRKGSPTYGDGKRREGSTRHRQIQAGKEKRTHE